MPSASALALWSSVVVSDAVVNRFSTNAICRQKNCVNPVFPGLQDLETMKTSTWTCPANSQLPTLEFCDGAVQHRVAVRSGVDVKKQEDLASTAYFYHLSGLKKDPWDFREPGKHSDSCVKAIWHLVCSTYLPKAPVNCEKGEVVPYLLPCRSECSGYLDACNVECCDESVQCTPEEGMLFSAPFQNFTGYSASVAPSMQCTGSSANGRGPSALLLLLTLGISSEVRKPALLLAAILAAMNLQGCDITASHTTGTWESRPNLLVAYSVKTTTVEASFPPRVVSQTSLNSCNSPNVEEAQKCGGHGVCTEFAAGVAFCQCSTGFTGPECRSTRKSQCTAFLLSLFTGFLGLDRFYLGELSAGTLKLSTLGGFGVWWLWDIIWIGSAPILTRGYGRLAAGLPHFIFVILAVLWVALVGYFIFGVVGAWWHESLILNRALDKVERISNYIAKHRYIAADEGMQGMPSKSTFRVAAPVGQRDLYGSMAESSPEVKLAAYKNEMSPFFLYAKASEQPAVKTSGAFSRSLGAAPQ